MSVCPARCLLYFYKYISFNYGQLIRVMWRRQQHFVGLSNLSPGSGVLFGPKYRLRYLSVFFFVFFCVLLLFWISFCACRFDRLSHMWRSSDTWWDLCVACSPFSADRKSRQNHRVWRSPQTIRFVKVIWIERLNYEKHIDFNSRVPIYNGNILKRGYTFTVLRTNTK